MKGKAQNQRPPEGAREAALKILAEWEKGGESLEAIRERSLGRTALPRKDRALVTELTQGVVRHRLLLEHNLRGRLARPDAPLPVPVRQAILLGMYQLLLLDRIPPHSAVDESVRLVKDSRFRGFAPLVNAVLRKTAASGEVPVPGFDEDPVGHMEISSSFPRWFVECLAAQQGSTEAREILRALNGKPPLTLRVNTLRTDRPSLLEELRSAGIDASPGPIAETAVVVREGIFPPEIRPFREGRCTVQDEGAQVIAPLLDPLPGICILDACAAPGGKTGHLAEITGNGALIVAADRNPARVRMMAQGLSRLGVKRVLCLAADMSLEGSPFGAGAFHRILLDAPCSGTGVLRRHPEGKWNKNLAAIRDLAEGQLGLLRSAARSLRPGGKLLYSTCSLLAMENEEVVARFLEENPALRRLDLRAGFPRLQEDLFSPRGDLRLWPHRHNCDGFFACLMEKGS